MKRSIILLLASFFLIATAGFAGNDKQISVDRLPSGAKQFIGKYFSELKVSYAKVDSDLFDKSYEVVFVNGCKVEFDKKGKWTDVDCKFSRVPDGIVPKQIKDYITAHHGSVNVIEIDRDSRDYEVKLDNGLELTFDLKFNLIEIDN